MLVHKFRYERDHQKRAECRPAVQTLALQQLQPWTNVWQGAAATKWRHSSSNTTPRTLPVDTCMHGSLAALSEGPQIMAPCLQPRVASWGKGKRSTYTTLNSNIHATHPPERL
jgi:hypothetical protein